MDATVVTLLQTASWFIKYNYPNPSYLSINCLAIEFFHYVNQYFLNILTFSLIGYKKRDSGPSK